MGTPTIPNIRNSPLAENQQITVAWSAPSSGEPLSYRLTLNPGNQVTTGIPGSYREYTFGSLVNGTLYSISIDATNDGSIYGPAANFLPASPGGPPSTAPINASAIPSGSNGITVSWNAPNPLPNPTPTFYIISSANVYAGDTPVSIVQQASGGNSVFIPNVDPTKAYQYTVQATNDVGRGPLAETNNVSFNQNGSVFDWGVQMYTNSNRAGVTYPCQTTAVATDTENSLYTTVQFYDSTFTTQNYVSTLGNGTISTTMAARFVSSFNTITGQTALVKYSSTGTLQWIAPCLNTGSFVTPALTTDSQNNIYYQSGCAGGGSRSIYNATSNVNEEGIMSTTQIFGTLQSFSASFRTTIIKYTSSGQVASVTPIGEIALTNTNQLIRNSIFTDVNDNVYIHYYASNSPVFFGYRGVLNGNIQTTPIAAVSTLSIGSRGILAKYDRNLDIQWATFTSPSLIANGNREAQLAVDSNGNSYVTTFISSPSTTIYQYGGSNVGTNPGVNPGIYMVSTYGTMLVSTSRSLQTLLTKYNTNGQVEWATQIFASTATATGVIGNAVKTDIYGNVFIAGSNWTNAPRFHSFQQRTSDGFISTGVTATFDRVTAFSGEFIAKYNTNGQFLRASGMTTPGNTNGLSNFNLVSDYLGNVYVKTGLPNASAASLTLTYFDYVSTVSTINQTAANMSWTRPFTATSGANATTYTIRKYNNDLQMQYLLAFSNAPYVSTTIIDMCNMCIDRTNALYVAGIATTSTIGTGAGITTPQTYIPVPQWQGRRGPPYGATNAFLQISSLALSSPMISTGTYSYILRYK